MLAFQSFLVATYLNNSNDNRFTESSHWDSCTELILASIRKSLSMLKTVTLE